MTYLLKENYDKTFIADVYQVPVVTLDELRRDMVKTEGPVRIPYSNRNQYKSAAKALGIMDDFKVSSWSLKLTEIEVNVVSLLAEWSS